MRGTHFAELSAFVAVAEQASFTKAARRLGRSTATLSQTVRALEDHLGVRLLNRTTRSVAPTDAGERLLAQLRPLLNGFEAAVEIGQRLSRNAGRGMGANTNLATGGGIVSRRCSRVSSSVIPRSYWRPRSNPG